MLQGMVAHYQVQERLGRGGMGDVYKAYDTRLQRTVAIKALHPEALSDRRAIARLRREALAAAAIDHPYLSHIHELLDHDGTLLIVMEYVEGETLAARLTHGKLPLLEALQLMKELAEALGAAHARELVHRDVKPSNVMITRHHHVKLMDFGLAKASPKSDDETRVSGDITALGEIVGTPFYMAPEQAAGDNADMRSDVFSLGVVLYECLAGRLPFDGTTRTTYLTHLLASEPQPLHARHPEIPLAVDVIVMRCLARDPALRYQTAIEVAADLARAYDLVATGAMPRPLSPQQARRPRSGRRLLVIAGILVAILIAAKVAIAPRPLDRRPAKPASLTSVVTWPSLERDSRLSPDGAWVSFLSNRDGQWRIWLQRGEGTPQPIAFPTGTVTSHAWSPDGAELACVLRHEGRAWLQVVPAFFGGTPRVTVALPWMSEGTRIVRWIGGTVYVEIPGPSSLWQVDLARAAIAELTPFRSTPQEFARDFAIDAEGGRVAYSSNRDGRVDLWTSALDGSARERVTDDEFSDRHPVWMGFSSLVYQTNRSGQIDLWHKILDGSPPQQITFSAVAEIPEDILSDGSVLTLQQYAERLNLWEVDTKTRAERQLTADALTDAWPTADGSGRTIAFQRSKTSVDSVYTFDNGVLHLGTVGRQGLADVRRLGEGFGAALSDDARWLAFLRPSAAAPGLAEVWVTDLQTQQTRRLTDRCPTLGYFDYPFNPVGRRLLWRPGTPELLFGVQLSDNTHAVRRWRPSDWAAEPGGLPPRSEPRDWIVDIAVDREGTRLAVLNESPTTRDASLSVVPLDAGADSKPIPLWRGADRRGALLGFRPGAASPLILQEEPGEGPVRSVAIVEASPAMPELARLDGVLRGSVRLDAASDALYLTRAEGLTHNLYTYDLTRRVQRAITSNQQPGITYAGVVRAGPQALVFSKQEVTRDTWRIRFTRPP